MRLRKNLKSMFRGVTEAEYANLCAAADKRRGLDPEDRDSFKAPPEADASVVGAILWSTFVIWQEHPGFVVLGCAGGLISTGFKIMSLF